MRTLYNILQAQIGWFALVLSAAAGQAFIGVSIAAALIVAHMALANERRAELAMMAYAAAAGMILDNALLWLGMIRFASSPGDALAPLWMIALWVLFATTLRHSLAWLQQRALVASAIGAVVGPIAYVAGERLGALQLPEELLSLAAVGAGWALALPALLRAARSAHRRRPAPRQYA